MGGLSFSKQKLRRCQWGNYTAHDTSNTAVPTRKSKSLSGPLLVFKSHLQALWNWQISCLYDYYLLNPCKNKGKLSKTRKKLQILEKHRILVLYPTDKFREGLLWDSYGVKCRESNKYISVSWKEKSETHTTNTTSCLKIFPVCDNKLGRQEGDIILGRQSGSSIEIEHRGGKSKWMWIYLWKQVVPLRSSQSKGSPSSSGVAELSNAGFLPTTNHIILFAPSQKE